MFELDELQHYPVNWTDGMRVSAKDLTKGDQAWADALRDVRATLLQGRQFGLLPPLRDSSDTTTYPKLEYETSRSLLTLKECRAITEGGYRIEITEDLQRQFQVPLKFPNVSIQQQEAFSVYVTVDMFDTRGAGKLSADAPPRYEVVCPLYEVSVLYKSDEIGLSGFNHLKIAEYVYTNGHFERNEEFIPNCMTINAHPNLIKRFSRAGAALKSIHDNGILVVQQYRMDSRADVKDAANWVEKIILFVAQSIWSYNDVLQQQSPLYALTFCKNFSQYILSTIDLYRDNDFIKKSAESQRQFFKHLADPNFLGDDLKTAFDRIDIALRAMDSLLKALSASFKQGRVVRVEELGK
jgi:hypothetical protein